MNTLTPRSETPFPGVLRMRFGTVPEPTLLGFAGVAPRAEALASMDAAVFPVDPGEIVVYRSSGHTVVRLPLTPDERLYGFGLQYRSLNHRGQLFELRVDHYKGRDDGRTHAPVPFCVSDRGYGVFVNTAARISVHAGRTHVKERHPQIRSRRDPDWRAVAVSEILEIALAEEGTEVVLFAGPSVLDVVRRFNLYCGGGCLPPKWGLGFWYRTPLDYTAQDVAREVDSIDAEGFPLDVIGLEPGWHSSSYPTTFEWHPDAFPDPAGFVGGLAERGIRVNLWENPFVHPGCRLGRELEALSASHTGSWGGYCPDLSMDEVRGAIAAQHAEVHLSVGVSGYKLDEVDDDNWLFPDYASFPSGIRGETIHQVYGLLFQRATVSMFREAGRRTYGQVRATNAGGVSFPYVVYNDCYDHREYITGLCSGSISGVLFTPEARDAQNAEEWLRRFQATCMSPLAQLNAWASGTRPWDFPEVADDVREAIAIRMRLVPYLYTAFAEYRERGIPPFRAMILEDGTDGGTPEYQRGALDATANPYSLAEISETSDQYMIGPSILAAPLFAGEPTRTVVLPPGRWFDFHTGDLVGDGGVVELASSYRKLPLLVRDGGIVPVFADAYTRVPASGTPTRIEVRHYGEKGGSFDLYDDDGETYGCENGESCRRLRRSDGSTGTAEPPRGPFGSGYGPFVWRFMGRE